MGRPDVGAARGAVAKHAGEDVKDPSAVAGGDYVQPSVAQRTTERLAGVGGPLAGDMQCPEVAVELEQGERGVLRQRGRPEPLLGHVDVQHQDEVPGAGRGHPEPPLLVGGVALVHDLAGVGLPGQDRADALRRLLVATDRLEVVGPGPAGPGEVVVDGETGPPLVDRNDRAVGTKQRSRPRKGVHEFGGGEVKHDGPDGRESCDPGSFPKRPRIPGGFASAGRGENGPPPSTGRYLPCHN